MTGDVFYTTNDAFQYTVGPTSSMIVSDVSSGFAELDSWLYSGESLESLCSRFSTRLVTAYPSLNLTLDRSQGSVNVEVSSVYIDSITIFSVDSDIGI
jgi:hypothetical protein